MKNQFKMVICSQCGLEIWYNTLSNNIDCTRCGFKVPVEPCKYEEDNEEIPNTD